MHRAVAVVLASILIAGCAADADGGPTADGDPVPGEPAHRDVESRKAYTFDGILSGSSGAVGMGLAPVKTQRFVIPPGATRINVTNEWECAPGGPGQYEFVSHDAGTVQVMDRYYLVGSPDGQACVIHGDRAPFPSAKLEPGNHTINYYVAGSLRAIVDVTYFPEGMNQR